jgi:hypothetical protein
MHSTQTVFACFFSSLFFFLLRDCLRAFWIFFFPLSRPFLLRALPSECVPMKALSSHGGYDELDKANSAGVPVTIRPDRGIMGTGENMLLSVTKSRWMGPVQTFFLALVAIAGVATISLAVQYLDREYMHIVPAQTTTAAASSVAIAPTVQDAGQSLHGIAANISGPTHTETLSVGSDASSFVVNAQGNVVAAAIDVAGQNRAATLVAGAGDAFLVDASGNVTAPAMDVSGQSRAATLVAGTGDTFSVDASGNVAAVAMNVVGQSRAATLVAGTDDAFSVDVSGNVVAASVSTMGGSLNAAGDFNALTGTFGDMTINQKISVSSTTQARRKVTLGGTASNDYEYAGLGHDSAGMVYNALSGSGHHFFVGANSSTATALASFPAAGGLKLHTGNVVYPDGSILSLANSYIPYTLAASADNAWPGAGGTIPKVTKIGPVVFFTATTRLGNMCPASPSHFSLSTIPAAYRPPAQIWFQILVEDGNAAILGGLLVDSDGVIKIYANPNTLTPFGTTGMCGYYSFSISWHV